MAATTDDTAMRFLIALLGGPMIGWAMGNFKSCFNTLQAEVWGRTIIITTHLIYFFQNLFSFYMILQMVVQEE
jgi:hypothetical protein